MFAKKTTHHCKKLRHRKTHQRRYIATYFSDTLYKYKPPMNVQQRLMDLEKKKVQFQLLKNESLSHYRAAQDIYKYLLTYTSNALDGNTLKYDDIVKVVAHKKTVGDVPIDNLIDAIKHAQAMDFLHDNYIHGNYEFTEDAICFLHKTLFPDGFNYYTEYGYMAPDKLPSGVYKSNYDYCANKDVDPLYMSEPHDVPIKMKQYANWLATCDTHAVTKAAIAHYALVRIHPFNDGNGRLARLIMNAELLKKEFPPCIIYPEDKCEYIDILAKTDKSTFDGFVLFIANKVEQSLDNVISLVGTSVEMK